MKNFQHHFIEIPVPLGTNIYHVEIFNKEAKLTPTKEQIKYILNILKQYMIAHPFDWDWVQITKIIIKEWEKIRGK